MFSKNKEPNIFLRIIVSLLVCSVIFLAIGFFAKEDPTKSIAEMKIAFKIVGFLILAGIIISLIVYFYMARKGKKTEKIDLNVDIKKDLENNKNVDRKEDLESKKKFEKIMKEKNISFFDAVWEYFKKVGAVKKFKEEYISGLSIDSIDECLENLTDKQVQLVKVELDKKIEEIKTDKYDKIFENTFKEEVKQEIEMSNEYAGYGELNGFVLGGMTPDVYLTELFDSSGGALFFYDASITWKGNKPLIKLDIDEGGIDWQPFD